VVWEITIVICIAEGADLCLEERDDVSILGVGYGTQEDGGSGACVEEIILLGL
jgi:hypothetical protein